MFPDPNRDNFGETIGLIEYDFRWHVGDRLTLFSDGFADVFTDGLQTVSAGGLIGRPEQGSLYVGFRTINGPSPVDALTPLHSNVLTANLNYRMSEKWIVSGGASYDFGPAGNIGQAGATDACRRVVSVPGRLQLRREPGQFRRSRCSSNRDSCPAIAWGEWAEWRSPQPAPTDWNNGP